MTPACPVKPSELVRALTLLYEARHPAHVWGSPGTGKSSVMAQVADSLGIQLIDVRAVLLDPVDLRGLPHINGGGRSHWAIPDFLPREGAGILFFDEANRSAPLVQNGLLQITLDRRLGEYRLPDGWCCMLAGNRESDGGGVTKLNSALSSRLTHLDLQVDMDDWCKWALSADVEPPVVAFLRFRPELLDKFDRTARAYPNPRSWSFVSRIVASHPDATVEHALFAGTVGEGAATEFSAFMRLYRTLPDMDAIIAKPDKAPVPDRPETLFAVASALARKANVQNWARILTYAERLPEEFSIYMVKDSVMIHRELNETKELTKYLIAHSDVALA